MPDLSAGLWNTCMAKRHSVLHFQKKHFYNPHLSILSISYGKLICWVTKTFKTSSNCCNTYRPTSILSFSPSESDPSLDDMMALDTILRLCLAVRPSSSSGTFLRPLPSFFLRGLRSLSLKYVNILFYLKAVLIF